MDSAIGNTLEIANTPGPGLPSRRKRRASLAGGYGLGYLALGVAGKVRLALPAYQAGIRLVTGLRYRECVQLGRPRKREW